MTKRTAERIGVGVLMAAMTVSAARVGAQTASKPTAQNGAASATPAPVSVAPPDFVVGVDDVLTVAVYGQKDFTGDVVVRPDGKISIMSIGDLQAAGLTPMQLAASVAKALTKYVEDPNVTVVVKSIGQKIYITGQVGKQGPLPYIAGMTVITAISLAGGLSEYADKKHVLIQRIENGKMKQYMMDYDKVTDPKNTKNPKDLLQNIELKPGDQIIVR